MSGTLSALDLFRKVPKDLTRATTHGGALSLLVFTLLGAVFLLEVWTYAAGETHSKIVLDQNNDEKLQINFAVSFHELPCQFAEVEVWDYLGNAKLDVTGRVTKNKVTGDHAEFVGRRYVPDNIEHEKDEGGVGGGAGGGDSGGGDTGHASLVVATQDNFGIRLKEKPFTFVLFYVDWCMYCRLVLPRWTQLVENVVGTGLSRKVQIATVDCVSEAQLCADSKISGYPTFMMFKDVHPLEAEYKGMRTVESFVEFIAGIVGAPDSAPAPELKEQWHEGCRLRGELLVNRVPGNFHISAKSGGHSFDQKSTNTSHIIHELTFGRRMRGRMLKKVPADVRENIDPLAGKAFVNHFGHMSHEHTIKVVSTHYLTGTLRQEDILGYQMAVSNHQFDADPNVPTATFSYDLSPTAVVISQSGRRWYEFLTSLCAIIGGMFTTFQLFNGLLGSVSEKVGSRSSAELISPQPRRR